MGAYVCYRPDLGYVQGMSFIAAILLLNLEEAEAFIVFANLVNRPLLAAFYRVIEKSWITSPYLWWFLGGHSCHEPKLLDLLRPPLLPLAKIGQVTFL